MRVDCLGLALLLAVTAAGCHQKKGDAQPGAGSAAPGWPSVPAPGPTTAPAPAKPTPAPEAAETDRAAVLVAQLGDRDFAAREKAGGELAAMGRKVVPLLEAATRDPDAEVAWRAAEIIERIKGAEEEAGVPDIPGLAGNFKRTLVQNPPIPGMTFSAGDPKGQGAVTLSMVGGGVVTLTVAPKGGEARTFTAPSLREFELRYPKLYAKYLDTSTAPASPEPPRPPALKPPPAAPAPARAPEAKAVDPELVAKLIKQLNDADAGVQTKAAAELARLGEPALPALKKAAAGSDDAAKRAGELAFKIEDDAAPKFAGLIQNAKGANKHGGHTPSTGGVVGNGHDAFSCGDAQGNELTVDYSGDGSVSVRLKTKKGEERSYTAPSLDEFKKRYPSIFKAYLAD